MTGKKKGYIAETLCAFAFTTALTIITVTPVHAQQNAPEANSTAGKLFTTAYQREYLDYLRRNFIAERRASGFDIDNLPPPILDDDTDTNTQAAEAVIYHFDGALTTPGGISVWLNGNQIREADLPDGIRVSRTGTGFELLVSNEGRLWSLKPGQVLNVTTGDVLESFEFR